MKFCVNCFHHAHVMPADVHVCHRINPLPDPVTGEPLQRFCMAERIDAPGQCGPDAVHFEAAEPF